MARTFGRRPVARRQQRRRVWARTIVSQQFTSAGNPVAFDLLGTFKTEVGADLPGLTVVRLVGRVQGAGAALGELTWGVLVANEDAVTASPAAYDPVTPSGRFLDWMYWDSARFNTSAPLGEPDLSFDIHSMRKVDEIGESAFLVGRATTANVTAYITCSALLLLP